MPAGTPILTRMTDEIATGYGAFGRQWAHGTSPLYEEWAVGISADPAVLDLLRGLPRSKRQPNLVFAAARWHGCPLAPYPTWRDWLLARWADVLGTIMTRTVHTNEVTRCATLIPALSRIDGSVALLEVGASAGLCLYPDRYSYRYDTPSGMRTFDPHTGVSRVLLPCRLDDVNSVPAGMPQVAWRLGIDLTPIDITDADAVAWLRTLVWPGPDHDGRVERLDAAATIAASDPPEILTGDLLETIADAAATSPNDATLVVFHSAVLLYLTPDDRQRFADTMTSLGRRVGRTIVWLSNESQGTFPSVDAQLPAATDTARRFIQSIDGVAVALAGQHGATYETRPLAAAH